MNATNTTSAEDKKAIAVSIVGLCLSMVITVFHCCAIYVTVKSKELKKEQFLRLTLFLSLSDGVFGVEIIYIILLMLFNTGQEAIRLQCMLIRDILGGTAISSLAHTLLICLNRLNATFTTKKRPLNILTGNISVGLCFAIPHAYSLVRFGIKVSIYGISACNSNDTSTKTALISHDIPVLLLTAAIAGVYGVVAKRMTKQQKIVGVLETTLTETQIAQRKAKALRFRKNMATLGIIVIIAVISAFPRAVMGLYIHITDTLNTMELYLLVCNLLTMLPPLLDPIIYLFRIKKYRDQLVCKCCRPNAVADSIELH